MQLTRADFSKLLLRAYPAERGLSRALLRVKPYVYPFHEVVNSVPEGVSVLDVGCGMGMMTVLLANLGKTTRAVGFDVSDKAIAKARIAPVPPNCDIVFTRIEPDSDWPSGRFDVALCIDVLHHVPPAKQRSFVRNLARTGGAKRIVLKDVSPRPFWMGMANIVTDLVVNQQLVHLVDEDDVAAWLTNEGFTIVEKKRIHALVYSHYLIVAERT